MIPKVRTDIIDAYVFRRTGGSAEFLQLRRVGEPLARTWQPVMGHVEAGETAASCARRELLEEVGLRPDDPRWLGFWQLEQVHPYFVAALDAVVLSPRFAAEVSPVWAPDLLGDPQHNGSRWVPHRDVSARFMWPGQVAACDEIVQGILPPDSLCEPHLRLPKYSG
ncbi:MAG: NUDIX hydrolase [Planctomycetota bacterium]